MKTLELVWERKLHRLIPGQEKGSRLEAGRVCIRARHCIVIFDNVGRLARIAARSTTRHRNGWLGGAPKAVGYEDITYDPRRQRFYALIEAVRVGHDRHRAEVVEYDRGFVPLERHALPFDFAQGNKGFEGLAHLRRDDQDYLLALCEGNYCEGGRAGRQQGNGRIQVFRRVPRLGGSTSARSSCPNRAIRRLLQPRRQGLPGDGALANNGPVVARHPGTHRVEIRDSGSLWQLPGGARGEPAYCNAEGVSWITPDQIAVVSDRRKKDAPKRCTAKDQPLHIFRIPQGKSDRSRRMK